MVEGARAETLAFGEKRSSSPRAPSTALRAVPSPASPRYAGADKCGFCLNPIRSNRPITSSQKYGSSSM